MSNASRNPDPISNELTREHVELSDGQQHAAGSRVSSRKMVGASSHHQQ